MIVSYSSIIYIDISEEHTKFEVMKKKTNYIMF